jgi:hypothetical protein
MRTRLFILLLALCFVLPSNSSAQFGALKKSLNKAINKAIENKVDTAVDKSVKENEKNNPDQASSSGQGNGGTMATGRGLFGGKIDIKFNEEYSFTGRIYMQMETYDKKDVLKSDFYAYFNTNTLNAGIEVKAENPENNEKTMPAVFLFDYDNRSFLMLVSNGESKTGIISSIPSDSVLAAQSQNMKKEPGKQAVITKTGNTRMIAGYKCDEYKVVEPDKDGYSNVWMTKDVKIKADRKNWNKSGMPSYEGYPGFENSFMLAMEAYEKDNRLAMKMETKEINENFSHSISTVGYTFMKMNFGQNGKK